MGKGGGGKQTTTSEPWKGTVPYLIGGKDASGQEQPGVFSQASNIYKGGFWTPEMGQVNDLYKSLFPARLEGADQMTEFAKIIAQGQYDTQNKDPNQVSATQVNPVAMRRAQGVLDPTNSLAQLLTGQVNNQYLDPMANTIAENISRNTRERVLPAIRSDAVGAGQYGGSRQGVAEGLALSRMNQDIATGIAPVYAQAFENAQNRMAGTASELNQQAQGIATGNADRQLNADQFNSNLTLQSNAQNLAANQAKLGNLLKASDLYGQALNFQDLGFGQFQQLLGMPTAYNRNNLAGYASIVEPGAGLGGTSTQTANQGRNPLSGAAGGAMLGASVGGAPGAAIGGLLGLVTGLL